MLNAGETKQLEDMIFSRFSERQLKGMRKSYKEDEMTFEYLCLDMIYIVDPQGEWEKSVQGSKRDILKSTKEILKKYVR